MVSCGDPLNHTTMGLVDIAPFIVVFLLGAAAGRLFSGRLVWLVALALPILHFALSVLTGRAGDELFTYVLPANVALGVLAVVGVFAGQWLSGHRRRN